jgi:signal peptidase I
VSSDPPRSPEPAEQEDPSASRSAPRAGQARPDERDQLTQRIPPAPAAGRPSVVTDPGRQPEEAGEPRAVTTEPARPQAPPRKKSPWRFLRELPVLILIAFVLALLIKSFLVQAFYIPSESMDPTLKIGDRVLVEKVLKHPHRGWIVVFTNPHPGPQPHRNWLQSFGHWLSEGFGISTPPDEDFIKRVIGLPGETIELRHGVVYIDGKRLREPYLNQVKDTRDFPPTKVPAGHVFVMGDNRTNSNDSRFGLGPIPLDDIVGRAFVIIWPPSRIRWLG